MSEPAQSLSVASDVRRLIKQVETGNGFDVDLTGHAYDVLRDAMNAIQARLGNSNLEQDVSARIENFATKSASTQMNCRMVVTDEMPELPEYDPSSVSIYDGIQDAGTDFSQVIQRSTIYGTLMTSVNITDLRAYFESGRKRHLVLYLGTDRNGDAKALDKMLAALPAILAAAGMDGGAIKEIIAAIKAGTLPPAAMKMVMQAIKLADLKAMPSTPQTRARIARIQKEFAVLAAKALPALANMPAIAKLIATLRATMLAPVRGDAKLSVTSLQTRTTAPRPDNDNKIRARPASTATAGTSFIMARFVPALVALSRPQQMAAALRAIEARVIPIARVALSAAPAVIKAAAAVVSRPPAAAPSLQSAKISPAMPQAAAVTKFAPTPAKIDTATGTATPVSVSAGTTPADRPEMARPVINTQSPVVVVPNATDATVAVTAQTASEQKILEVKTPDHAPAEVKPADQKLVEQKPAEKSEVPDCCKALKIAAADGAPQTSGAEILQSYTPEQIRHNETGHAKLSEAIDRKRAVEGALVAKEDQQKWDADLANLKKGAKGPFDHVCPPGCEHGKTITGSAVAKDVSLSVASGKDPIPEPANRPAWLPPRAAGLN